jgi:hydroxymethylbilane synthase
MIKKIIRIGTRGSKLALYQAYRVRDELQKQFPDLPFSIEIIKTKGDKILDVALSKIGDKGLFTKEIEEALFNNEIDMAVHSLKDLPTKFPDGAKLGAVLKRGEIRDAVISRDGRKIENLTSQDTIATSSLRRKAQLLRINKDFKIIEIRGNVNTRIRKMEEGYCDVMVMSAAGLQRLEMDQYITEYLEPERIIPACSQGAIAVEIRENDSITGKIVSTINDVQAFLATEAERAFLRTLEGGCQIPVGSYTGIDGDKFKTLAIFFALIPVIFYVAMWEKWAEFNGLDKEKVKAAFSEALVDVEYGLFLDRFQSLFNLETINEFYKSDFNLNVSKRTEPETRK